MTVKFMSSNCGLLLLATSRQAIDFRLRSTYVYILASVVDDDW